MRSMTALTADQIKGYLDTQDDFDLELSVYRTLVERGVPAQHGGTYIDSATGKARQFDVRAMKDVPGGRGLLPWSIALAIECKSLSVEYPLIISRVPRQEIDSFHEVVESLMHPRTARACRCELPPTLYPRNKPVGKKTTQVRWDAKRGEFISSDAESYDKWGQALSSAHDLVQQAFDSASNRGVQQFFMLILPLLVVPDQSLWVVDYDEAGLRGEPQRVETTALFVGREYPLGDQHSLKYTISHLEIMTQAGLQSFVSDLVSSKPVGIWERGFRSLIKE
jgi:hypothetical protein